MNSPSPITMVRTVLPGHSQDALFSLECGERRQLSSLVPLFLKVFKKQSKLNAGTRKGILKEVQSSTDGG